MEQVIRAEQWREWLDEPETRVLIENLREAAEAADLNFSSSARNAVMDNDPAHMHRALRNAAYAKAYADILDYVERLAKGDS